jgi:hypothetical protein
MLCLCLVFMLGVYALCLCFMFMLYASCFWGYKKRELVDADRTHVLRSGEKPQGKLGQWTNLKKYVSFAHESGILRVLGYLSSIVRYLAVVVDNRCGPLQNLSVTQV